MAYKDKRGCDGRPGSPSRDLGDLDAGEFSPLNHASQAAPESEGNAAAALAKYGGIHSSTKISRLKNGSPKRVSVQSGSHYDTSEG